MPYHHETRGEVTCNTEGCKARISTRVNRLNDARKKGWVIPHASEGEPAWCPEHGKSWKMERAPDLSLNVNRSEGGTIEGVFLIDGAGHYLLSIRMVGDPKVLSVSGVVLVGWTAHDKIPLYLFVGKMTEYSRLTLRTKPVDSDFITVEFFQFQGGLLKETEIVDDFVASLQARYG